MSDTQSVPRYPADMGERVARLEQIADDTRQSLDRIERGQEDFRKDVTAEFRAIRVELGTARAEVGSVRSEIGSVRTELGGRIDAVQRQAWTQFAFLALAMMALLAVVSRGFHWIS